MKVTRHTLLAKGILVLLSLLIMIFIFTYSWFVPPTVPVHARGVQVHTKSDADFEYAIGFYSSETGGNYKVTAFSSSSETLDLEHLNVPGDVDEHNELIDYNLLVDYKPIDVTGDGATLIRPAMQYSNSGIDTSSNNYSIANPNKQYITFDLILRSQQTSAVIKLASESYAKGAVEQTAGDGSLSGANADNKSSYGDFSKDAVVGAIRVAFIDYSNLTISDIKSNSDTLLDNSAALLWLPRPDIKLNTTNRTDDWTLSTGLTSGAAGSNYTYQYDETHSISTNTFTHTYYKIFEGANSSSNHTVVAYNDTVTDLTTPQPIADMNLYDTNHVLDSTSYYYTKVKVRIWVEGTDPEARRAISGGQFSVNFELSSKNN